MRNPSSKSLYIALIICSIYVASSFTFFGGVASAYSPTPFVAGSPRVVLRPFNIAPGKSDQVTGVNFTPLSNITVTFAGNVVATIMANSTGGFIVKFLVSANTPQGLYPVSATDNSASKLTGQNTLNVLVIAKIVLNTGGKAHIVGAIVTVNGTGFSVSKSVKVYFNNQVVASATTNSGGNFVASFALPSNAAGTYNINATDGTNNVFKTFVLTSHVTISPNTMVTVGSKVTIAGTGFSASSQVSFTFGGTPLTTKITTTSLGAFSVQITIPPVAKGGYQLVGTDQNGHKGTGRVGVSN